MSMAIVLLLTFPITAYAEEGKTDAGADQQIEQITVLEDLSVDLPAGNEPNVGAATVHYPISVEEKRLNGRNVVAKTYELPEGVDPEQLVEDDFEIDGFLYSRSEILRQELPGETESKLAYTTVSFRTDSDKSGEVMGKLTPVMDYEEDGYVGQLELDYASVSTSVEGTKSYSYAIQESKEYTNLDRNDLSYIPKSITGKNGQTLQLSDVNWTPLGGSMRGDSILPPAYTATAIYCGTATGSSATGYLSSAVYKGIVTKKLSGKVQYTILYEGTKIPTDWGSYALIGFLCLLGAGVLVLLIIFGRKLIREMTVRHNRKVMEQKRAESRAGGDYHDI